VPSATLITIGRGTTKSDLPFTFVSQPCPSHGDLAFQGPFHGDALGRQQGGTAWRLAMLEPSGPRGWRPSCSRKGIKWKVATENHLNRGR